MNHLVTVACAAIIITACSPPDRETVTREHAPPGTAVAANIASAIDPEQPWVTNPPPTTPPSTTPPSGEQSADTTTTTTEPARVCRPAISPNAAVLFAPRNHRLTDPGIVELDRLVADLCADKDTALHVRGHTDNEGGAENLDLSRRRAGTVAAWLREQGFTNVEASGGGEHEPIADNSTEQGRRLNRRVTISIVN